MDEDWEDEVAGQNVNFIPCVKWIKRGVAKSQPEKVDCFEFCQCLFSRCGHELFSFFWRATFLERC